MKCSRVILLWSLLNVLVIHIGAQERISLNDNLIKADADYTNNKTTTLPKTTTPIPKPTHVAALVCPSDTIRRPFFAPSCKTRNDCAVLGKEMVCCKARCLKGVEPPEPEPKHEPALFGLVDRTCPSEPIPEILKIQRCKSDEECGPRICCPEVMADGKTVGFCRTAQPNFDKIPVIKQFSEPINVLVSYIQCTAPPPPLLDLFPKPCNNQLDCFPNLCCQEKGKKYCRPPKRSLLSLVASVSRRIVPTRAARKFFQAITQ